MQHVTASVLQKYLSSNCMIIIIIIYVRCNTASDKYKTATQNIRQQGILQGNKGDQISPCALRISMAWGKTPFCSLVLMDCILLYLLPDGRRKKSLCEEWEGSSTAL